MSDNIIELDKIKKDFTSDVELTPLEKTNKVLEAAIDLSLEQIVIIGSNEQGYPVVLSNNPDPMFISYMTDMAKVLIFKREPEDNG